MTRLRDLARRLWAILWTNRTQASRIAIFGCPLVLAVGIVTALRTDAYHDLYPPGPTTTTEETIWPELSSTTPSLHPTSSPSIRTSTSPTTARSRTSTTRTTKPTSQLLTTSTAAANAPITSTPPGSGGPLPPTTSSPPSSGTVTPSSTVPIPSDPPQDTADPDPTPPTATTAGG